MDKYKKKKKGGGKPWNYVYKDYLEVHNNKTVKKNTPCI